VGQAFGPAIATLVLFLAFTGLHAQAPAITIKLATVVPQASVWDKNLKQMGDEWSQATGGRVTVAGVTAALGWPRHRVDTVLAMMMQEGMAWIDTQARPDNDYWFPSLFDKWAKAPEPTPSPSALGGALVAAAGAEERKRT